MTQTGALLVYQLILTVQIKFRDHGKISVFQCGTRIRVFSLSLYCRATSFLFRFPCAFPIQAAPVLCTLGCQIDSVYRKETKLLFLAEFV